MKLDLKIIIGYYMVLLAILISWVNINNVSPSMSIRIAYSLFFFIPLFFYPHTIPAFITVFFTIRVNSVAPFGYLPSESLIYLLFLVIARIFAKNQYKYFLDEKSVNKIAFVFILYTTAVTLLNLSTSFAFLKHALIVSLLYYFVKCKFSISLFFSSFIVYSLILSFYTYFFKLDFEFVEYNSLLQEMSRSFWTDPNYLGAIIGIGTVLSLTYLLKVYRPFNSLYMDLLCLITCIATLYSLLQLSSRGALFSTVPVCIVVLYVSEASNFKKFALTVLICIVAYLFYEMGLYDTILKRMTDDSGGSGRMLIWKSGLNNYYNQNISAIVFGGGADWALVLCRKGWLDFSPHNNFLQFLFDYGIIGLTMFLLILYKLVEYSKNKRMSFICILYVVFSCMTICPFQFPCFPLFLGFCFCLTKIDRRLLH